MPTIPDKSVDMVLADLPYGVTACKWDTLLPLNDLWLQFKRLCDGAMVFTATQPFTSKLVMSQPDLFKYEMIWLKGRMSGFMNAKRAPLRNYENILVFSRAPANYSKYTPTMKYYPQMKELSAASISRYKYKFNTVNAKQYRHKKVQQNPQQDNKFRYPDAVLKFNHDKNPSHPTQKPAALFEYLIKTYTNEGDTVLDPTAGSGTTAVACKRNDRHYICIEKEPEYCAIAEKRIKEML